MIRSLGTRKVGLSHGVRSAPAHLRGLYPGNEVVTAREHAFRAEGWTPRQAAVRRMALRETPAAA